MHGVFERKWLFIFLDLIRSSCEKCNCRSSHRTANVRLCDSEGLLKIYINLRSNEYSIYKKVILRIMKINRATLSYRYPNYAWIPPSNNNPSKVAKWLAHLPFTSKVAGSNLTENFPNATRTQSSCEKSKKSTLCRKSWVFSGYSGFLPQGKLTGWVR
jgi:hypothetical protein